MIMFLPCTYFTSRQMLHNLLWQLSQLANENNCLFESCILLDRLTTFFRIPAPIPAPAKRLPNDDWEILDEIGEEMQTFP